MVYSAPGESADDVIERLLGSLGASATLYTGDFALQRTALARGASRATPHEFADLLDELPAVTRSPAAPDARASRTGSRRRPCGSSKRSGGRINTPPPSGACQQMSCRRLRIKVNGSTC